MKPIHPGEILREEFLAPLNLNPHRLAMAPRVPAPSIYEIVNEERAISPEMALRLARYFKTTPEFWMNLQSRFDLQIALDKTREKVEREVQPLEAVSAKD
ncbi:MAG TPA: HigA family addiction module antitoxin [Candidatus Acidoferrales bacterium]|nr:HigA family addiction module antitoxin [Candidatus Acidoferrales bacterium]